MTSASSESDVDVICYINLVGANVDLSSKGLWDFMDKGWSFWAIN